MKNGKHLIRGMRVLLLIFGGFLLGWEAFGNSVKPIATFGEWTRRLCWSSSWNTGDLSRFATQAKTAYEKDAADYKSRVQHAVTTLLAACENPLVAKYASTFGFKLDYLNCDFVQERDYRIGADTPAINAMADDFVRVARPAVAAAIADLEAIPTEWKGTIKISADEYPVDEDVYLDAADLLCIRAMLICALSKIDMLSAYDNTIDWVAARDHFDGHTDCPPISIVVLPKEPTYHSGLWERVNPVRGQTEWGHDGLDDSEVRVGSFGHELFIRVKAKDKQNVSLAIGSLNLNFEYEDGSSSYLNVDSSGKSGSYTTFSPSYSRTHVSAYRGDYNDGCLVRVTMPDSFVASNCRWKHMSVNGFGWTYYERMTDARDVFHLLYEQTGLFSKVRNAQALANAKTEMISSLDLALVAVERLQQPGRSYDDTLHFFERDALNEVSALQIAQVREWVAQVRDSLQSEQVVNLRTLARACETTFPEYELKVNYETLDEICRFLPNGADLRFFLGAFYSGRMTRALLPEARLNEYASEITDIVPTLETLSDPTLGGLLPEFKLSHYEKAIDEHCPRAVEHAGDYVVRFDGNGETSGRMEKSLSCSQGCVYQLPQNQFKKDGCRFVGWKCSNGRRYDDGMLFFDLRFWKDSDVIMTAIWE